MLSSIVTIPPRTLISPVGMVMLEKNKMRSVHHRYRCYTNSNIIYDDKPVAAAFPCLLFSRPGVSSTACRLGFHLDAATSMQESAAADYMDKEEEEEGLFRLPGGLDPELMPKHVAIIMDGHGRWAKERGLPTHEGHYAGRDNLKKLVLSACSKFRIEALTVFAFSTENWKRSQAETDFLMNGYEELIRFYIMELIQRHDLRFSVIGDKSRLPPSLQSTISMAEESSKANTGMHFVMALSYSGRLDMTEASKKITRKVREGILEAEDINEDILQQHLMTSAIQVPDVDLLIRTSGELRVSNFLLWQLAYAEFYFFDKMFPELDDADLVEAFSCFQRRKRRYGGRSG